MSATPEFVYSEMPAIDLFRALGYQYADAAVHDERPGISEVLLKDRLLAAIQRINPWINEFNLFKAYNELTSIQAASLMEANQKAWELLKGSSLSVKQVINGKEEHLPVWFIDYQNPENNDFLVVNQMRFKGLAGTSIPDLVVFVNGLPLAVIECKSPGAANAWDTAFNDLKFYQENSEKLFWYNQVCAGIWKENGRYGGIKSPAATYSFYKSNDNAALENLLGRKPTGQDILLYSLFQKATFLDLVRHFVVFELEEGTMLKKLPRYQQIRATNKTIEKLQEQNQGGVVWHTQGSGKSITMAYITRKLQAPEFGFNNPTVLVMTDRKDLDRQITTTFQNIGFKGVSQATSVMHLDKLLRNDYGGIITTTLQKFQEKDPTAAETSDQTEQDEHPDILVEKSIAGNVLTKVTKQLIQKKWVETAREEVVLEQLSNKENLYILVDEAHRSHYGFLASFMRTVLPKSKFIAFTGTPISKEDKSTLAEFYGQEYLDIYTIKESVADGATVELLYDEGIAKLDVKKAELDKEFEAQFGSEPEEKKEKLKNEALRKYQLSRERILEISKHLLKHYAEKIRPDGHKALLVCAGREAAIRYQETILQLKAEGYHNFETKVVISLGTPKSDEIARAYYETVAFNEKNPDSPKSLLVTPSEKIKEVTEDFKLPFPGDADTEKAPGTKKTSDDTAILIVSDMLLTGYDAPIASCLYLDKPLKEHNLLQAIARVNRSRKGKAAGYIVDYNGITNYLIQALEIFSGDVHPDDILKNLNEEIPKLALNHAKLLEFFKPLKIDRNYEREKFMDAAVEYLEPLHKWEEFKDLLKHFNKSVNIVLPRIEALPYQPDFKLFNWLKSVMLNAGKDGSLKISQDESKMLQALIDAHLVSEGVQNLLHEPVSIIDKDKFKADILNASPATKELKMRNNLKYTIKVGLEKNPDFYKPLAQRLEELLKLREEERITQAELFKAYSSLQDAIINENQEGHAKGFTSPRQIAVFNSLKTRFNGAAEQLTQQLFAEIQGELEIVAWETKDRVKKDMEDKITGLLKPQLERKEAKTMAKELVEILRKNKDA